MVATQSEQLVLRRALIYPRNCAANVEFTRRAAQHVPRKDVKVARLITVLRGIEAVMFKDG